MEWQFKVLIFWAVLTSVLWLATAIHYSASDSNLRWKYFKEDYSIFGALYCVSLYAGCVAIPLYLLIKAAIWWFTL